MSISPTFVHSWFRSGSTWLWSKFRHDQTWRAYYEPLNEELVHWTVELLKTRRAQAFVGDRHPELNRPYFYEYLDLIANNRLGYDTSFAYDRYMLTAHDVDDRLETYLSGLILAARADGFRPALCFCRSQLRIQWMKETFAGTHIGQVRNPWDQWVSFGRHPYFKQRVVITALKLNDTKPGSFSHIKLFDDLVRQLKANGGAQVPEPECFGMFITLWLASTMQVLDACDIIIDVDLLGCSVAHRRQVEAQLADSGMEFDLRDCKTAGEPAAAPSYVDEQLNRAVAAFCTNARVLLPAGAQVHPRATAQLGVLSTHSAGFVERMLGTVKTAS